MSGSLVSNIPTSQIERIKETLHKSETKILYLEHEGTRFKSGQDRLKLEIEEYKLKELRLKQVISDMQDFYANQQKAEFNSKFTGMQDSY